MAKKVNTTHPNYDDRTLGGVGIRNVKITDKQKKAIANIKKNDKKKK